MHCSKFVCFLFKVRIPMQYCCMHLSFLYSLSHYFTARAYLGFLMVMCFLMSLFWMMLKFAFMTLKNENCMGTRNGVSTSLVLVIAQTAFRCHSKLNVVQFKYYFCWHWGTLLNFCTRIQSKMYSSFGFEEWMDRKSTLTAQSGFFFWII